MASRGEASVDEVYTEDVCRVAPVPPSRLSSTSSTYVPLLDSQAPSQSTRSEVATVSAVVAVVAGAQLAKKFIDEDTLSTKSIRQQRKSESEELTAGKEYSIEEHATYSYVTRF